MMKRCVPAIALFGFTNCGGSPSRDAVGRSAAPTVDTNPTLDGAGGSASAGPSGGPAGSCVTELDELSAGCLPTFDGSAAQLSCSSQLDGTELFISLCQDLVSYEIGGGFWSELCSYDSSSHALVGVLVDSDTTSYCNHTSFTQRAGRVPAADCRGQLTACHAGGSANDDGFGGPPK